MAEGSYWTLPCFFPHCINKPVIRMVCENYESFICEDHSHLLKLFNPATEVQPEQKS